MNLANYARVVRLTQDLLECRVLSWRVCIGCSRANITVSVLDNHEKKKLTGAVDFAEHVVIVLLVFFRILVELM